MSLLDFLAANLSDVRQFGPGILKRHYQKAAGKEVLSVRLRGYGPLHFRRWGLDLEQVRGVLGEGGAYDVPWPPAAAARLEAAYRAILTKGGKPVIVNGGGHIGLSALWFARRWPEAEIVSIEPDEQNLELLRRNLADRPRQTIVAAALGSVTGNAVLRTEQDGCAIQSDRSEGSGGVPIVTMDEAVAQVPGGIPFICNVDIEGFEEDLFACNVDWIDSFSLVVIEPHDWREPGRRLSANFQREMTARPFEIYMHGLALHYLRI